MPTLEDEIEEQRQKMVAQLKASGKPGTKVTPESFAVWQEAKRKKRQEEAKKKVEAEMKKKKGGKGLSVLSGRDLFEYKRDLFKDRDDDDDGGILDVNQPGASTAPAVSAKASPQNGKAINDSQQENGGVEKVAAQVQSDLFLEGDDDDLDDIEDDE